jgi:hypothetical protein
MVAKAIFLIRLQLANHAQFVISPFVDEESNGSYSFARTKHEEVDLHLLVIS